MKKAVSILLVFVMVFSLCCVAATAEKDGKTVFTVVTDIHYKSVDTLPVFNPDSELYFHAERTGNLHAESGAIIDAFLAQEAQSDSEFILVCGDQCTDENPDDERIVAEKFAAFERETGKQIYVINGNHDIKNKGMTVESFCEIYNDFGYDVALARDTETCSYTASLNDEYRLIAIDSCSHGTTGDAVDARLLRWIKAQCENATADGKKIIAIMHHNLLRHYVLQDIVASAYMLENSELIASLFASWGIYCVFTGHEHSNDVATFINAAGKRVYDVTTTSLGASPVEYRVAEFSEESIDIKMRAVESIDTGTIADKGYTDAQLTAINTDFTDYADDYFKAGLCNMFSETLCAQGIGLEESSALYPVVDMVLKKVNDFINLPLYPVGSSDSQTASSIAGRYGVSLPESGYATGYELVYAVMKAHYNGNESFGADTVENELLLKLVDSALFFALDGLKEELKLNVLSTVFDCAGIDCRGFGEKAYSSVSTVLNMILHPIAVGFATVSGPSDRDITLPAYESADALSTFNSLFAKLREFFDMFILSFRYLFN